MSNDKAASPTRPQDGVARALERDTDNLRAATARALPPLSALAQQMNEKRSHASRGEREMKSKKNRSMWLKLAAVAFVLTVAGAVFATTQTGVISFWVDTEGKTDEQIETEIEDQLVQGGMQNPAVEVDRDGQETTVDIAGNQDGRQIRLIKKEEGGDPSVIQMQHQPLDTERDPGMTDEQLKAKIEAQLQARGMNGEVEVNGNEIRIRATKEVECESGDDCDED